MTEKTEYTLGDLDQGAESPDESALHDGAENEGRGRGPSQAAKLVELAEQHYRLFTGTDGRSYAVALDGPNIALPLRGRSGVRTALARRYTDVYRGQVPSQTALADALTVLEGHANDTAPEPVHLRVARFGDALVLDLGTVDGDCVVASPEGWEHRAVSPVTFRRTGLTSPIPAPSRDTDGLGELRGLVNADEDAFRLLVGWLVAALIPDIPHPVLAFKGEQGTGKSTAATMAVNLVDPSPAPLRSMPRDVKQWAVTASASWVVCLDNVSTIAPWLSDTLCKAVTGDGLVDRALYSDDDVTVISFRRVLAMTSIDTGTLAGDLSERLLTVELQPITRDRRRPDADVAHAYEEVRPVVLGALLDLLCEVLAALPTLSLSELPRMADFARVLGAVDQVRGWSTLATYTNAADTVAADLLDGEPFGRAVVDYVERHGQWRGTVGDLLTVLPVPEPRPARWPKGNPQAGSQLKRLAPVFRTLGISFDDTQRGSDRKRARLYVLTAENAGGPLSAPSAPSTGGGDQQYRADTSGPGGFRADGGLGGGNQRNMVPSAVLGTAELVRRTTEDRADNADSPKRDVSTDLESERPKSPCRSCGRPHWSITGASYCYLCRPT
ncbi:ATP-binding protein [Nocardiopsis dassonvillei]